MDTKKDCCLFVMPEKRKLELFCKILSLELYDLKPTNFIQKEKTLQSVLKYKPINF